MNLYLLRHGEAEFRQYDDPTRALTAHGQLEVEDVARQFARHNIVLDLCLHSPYLRTTQTAAVFLTAAGSKVQPEGQSVLTPNHRAAQVLDYLKSVQMEHVLLVTHNPLVSELFAVLTDTDTQMMHIFNTSELNAVSCVAPCRAGATALFRLQARV